MNVESKGTGVVERRLPTLFWAVSAAVFVSRLGSMAMRFAVPWIMLQNGIDAENVLMTMAAQAAPNVVSPWLGWLVDRFDRRRVMTVSEVSQALLVLISIPMLQGGHPLPVAGVLLLLGCGGVVSGLASDYGLIPLVITDERQLPLANSRYVALSQGAFLAGPAIGGVLVAADGANWILYGNAVSFLGSAAVSALLPRPAARAARGQGGVLLALRWLLAHRKIRTITLVLACYNLGVGAAQVYLAVQAESRWGWSSSALGVVLGVAGVSGMAGAWSAGRIWAAESYGRRIQLWLLICGVGAVAVGLGAVPWVVLPGYVLLMFAEGAVNVTSQVMRQMEIAPALAGRVNALIRCVVLGASPLSSLVVGFAMKSGTAVLHGLPIAVFTVLAGVALAMARRGEKGS
ncbi:MFS transporter [Streptomyces sp. NPDC005336]|uniref:MFS transporter n=1 Tax=Streptomyces sp. NPDC005336 TaxID=3157035 RepID=UPI0033A4FC21